MTTVRLTRGFHEANMFRKFKVYIDGDLVGMIKRQQTLEFDISPGYHEMQCKIDWESSNLLRFELGMDGIEWQVDSKGLIESVFRSLYPLDGRDKYLVLYQKK